MSIRKQIDEAQDVTRCLSWFPEQEDMRMVIAGALFTGSEPAKPHVTMYHDALNLHLEIFAPGSVCFVFLYWEPVICTHGNKFAVERGMANCRLQTELKDSKIGNHFLDDSSWALSQ